MEGILLNYSGGCNRFENLPKQPTALCYYKINEGSGSLRETLR